MLEVLAERADAHREPGVLVALVVHVLADVMRVARREDKDHAQAAAAVRHAVEHRVVAVARHLAEAALRSSPVPSRASRRSRSSTSSSPQRPARTADEGPWTSRRHCTRRRGRTSCPRGTRTGSSPSTNGARRVVAPAVGGDVVDVVVFEMKLPS